MINTVGLTRGLSFTKIIGGISKTLQIANQIIPLYQKTKPIIQNARNVFGVLKEMNKGKTIEATEVKEIDTKKPEIKKESKIAPTFFL